jgi:uncharacterized membrane protein (TIGR02234 family)
MPTPGRRTFLPVLLPGVGAGALAAVASAKPWAELGSAAGGALGEAVPVHAPGLESAGQVPLASALSLVALAAWGALLVTRGRARGVLAALGLLAAVVLAGVAVAGAWTAPDGVRTTLDREFALPAGSSAGADVGLTGWYWVALAGSVVLVATFAAAVRFVRTWPAMAGRYDAPGSRRRGGHPGRPASNQELWKAIDDGHDPTE